MSSLILIFLSVLYLQITFLCRRYIPSHYLRYLDYGYYIILIVSGILTHSYIAILWFLTGTDYYLFVLNRSVLKSHGINTAFPELNRWYRFFLKLNKFLSAQSSVTQIMVRTQATICLITTVIYYAVRFFEGCIN